MKKIMFSERYGLQQAVLDGTKTMTRRIVPEGTIRMEQMEVGILGGNLADRIKEHKEQFDPQTIPDLYHVAEYYKSVGMEIVCCCLQAYGKDSIFTQDEVKAIIEKED